MTQPAQLKAYTVCLRASLHYSEDINAASKEAAVTTMRQLWFAGKIKPIDEYDATVEVIDEVPS